MKYRILITCIWFLIACSHKEQTNHSNLDSSINFEELKGIWNLSFYPDSCIVNKDIYKYSVFPASFAYQIEIQNEDSCFLNGFHESDFYDLKKLDSVTYKVNSDPNHYFLLKFKKADNNISMTFNEYIDTSVYSWGKVRNESYNYFKTDKKIENLNSYLIERIFVGNYTEMKSGNEVDFKMNQTIIGLESFNYFEPTIDIWEQSPGKFNLIYLGNRDNSKTESEICNWEFLGDKLIFRILTGSETDFDFGNASISDTLLVLTRKN